MRFKPDPCFVLPDPCFMLEVKMMRQCAWLSMLVIVAVNVATGAASDKLPDVVEFNRDIRPILSENCFFCHGPDKNTRKADLRLDTQAGLTGAIIDPAKPSVVIPGQPKNSELIQRATTSDPALLMPPAESGKKLSAHEIELLKRWIEQGAKYEGHWSFLPVRRPQTPVVPRASGQVASSLEPGNSIDAFIRDTLQKLNIRPGAEADRVTLIRRLSFDLIGLPPTPEQVDLFVNDHAPDAYGRLVDRLLDSPHYGERLAIWWLDLVRYADTVGYHGDQDVAVSPFRQYVIDSFNSNKRFDQFTVEQLAGDLFANPTREQLIASGYNRLGMMSAEGGVQEKEYLAKYIAERVRNATGTWLGVTLGCAECHDHKYDPFTTQDFYRFEAFFADIEERGLYSGANADGNWGKSIKVPTVEQEQALREIDAQIAAIKQLIDTATPELEMAQEIWEQHQVTWQVCPLDSYVSENGATLTLKDDGSVLASGNSPVTDTYTVRTTALMDGITGIRLEILKDDSLPRKGLGRAPNGSFVLTEFDVYSNPAEGVEQRVELQNPTASHEQTTGVDGNPYGKWAIAAAIDHDAQGKKWGWAVRDKLNQSHIAMFETMQDLTGHTGSTLTVCLHQNNEDSQHTFGRFRLAVTRSPRPIRYDLSVPPAINDILLVASDQRSDPQRTELAAYYRSVAPALESARQSMAKLEKQRGELDAQIPRSLVTASVQPRMVRVLRRGNWMDDTGEAVTPAFPALLSTRQPTETRLTRMDLGRWLTAADNPLTARVFVNRIWKILFGAGLSRRVDDLGAQGDWPSHPLLLDHLAAQFMDSGWDVKFLIKTIVMSDAYRQSSLVSPELRELDPYNRWLARQGRFRLDAELVRDNALAISGLLVSKLGGFSVKPYQPPGYWAHLNFPTREWQNGNGEELYRRGLYTHWQRQYLHPSLLAFDAPSREECTADRARSNTPLQSLVLLNDPTYVEAARALAELVIRKGGSSTNERIGFAFRRAVSRNPTINESKVLEQLLQKHVDEFKSDPAAAAALLSVGAKPTPADLDKVELAAWTSIARTLLNLHESITRN